MKPYVSLVALALSALASSSALAAEKNSPADKHPTTALRHPHAASVKPAKVAAPVSAKKLPPILQPKIAIKPPCLHQEVDVTRGTEEDKFSLTRCDGSAAPLAVEHLSILARPGNAARPEATLAALTKVKGANVAPGIKRIDVKLIERLQAIVDHFAPHAKAVGTAKEEPKMVRLQVISGYRPSSVGSYHASGRALDVRLEGISNEALVAFCKTLPDTGCGYYPNSSFIHIDVRDPQTGRVSWIDASGPGESPRYVSAWPPPAVVPEKLASAEDALTKLDKTLQPLPFDEHPAEAKSLVGSSAAKTETQTGEAAPFPTPAEAPTLAANAPPAKVAPTSETKAPQLPKTEKN